MAAGALAAARAPRLVAVERVLTRDPHADREPVVRLHAALTSGVLVLLALGLATHVEVLVLRAIQGEELKERLLVAGTLGLALVAALSWMGLGALSRGLLRRLDRRWPLPLPGSSGLRRVLYLGVPLFVGSFFAVQQLGEASRIVLIVGALGLVAGAAILFTQAIAWFGAKRGWLGLALSALTFAIGVAGAGHAASFRDPGLLARVEERAVVVQALEFLRAASDVDRDGSSNLYGGLDCRPFDPAVSPGAREVPENGLDENCDGRDVSSSGATAGPRFSRPPSAGARPLNVVWFIVDAMRADHTSVYGYKKKTTPYLERLADESLVFERAYTQASSTKLSIPSMLMGVDPGRMTWNDAGAKLHIPADGHLAAERFQERGYLTGLVGSQYFKTIPGFTRGYQEVLYTTRDQHRSAPEAMAHSVAFIERAVAEKKPFFLTTYLAAPHDPYVKHEGGYLDFGKDEMGRYDSELAAADRSIGFILESLRIRPEVWNETVVVVAADHGEEFGEHGSNLHARTCFVESVHVPLIVRLPGRKKARIERRVGLVDVLPTLIELVDLPHTPEERLDGHSLILSADDSPELDVDRPIFCNIIQIGKKGITRRRAVRTGTHTYMEETTGAGHVALYAAEDTAEKSPLALEGEASTVAERLRALLADTMDGNLQSVVFD